MFRGFRFHDYGFQTPDSVKLIDVTWTQRTRMYVGLGDTAKTAAQAALKEAVGDGDLYDDLANEIDWEIGNIEDDYSPSCDDCEELFGVTDCDECVVNVCIVLEMWS